MNALHSAIRDLDWLILIYVGLVDLLQTALMAGAATDLAVDRRATRHLLRGRLLSSPAVPSISVLAPAHNEEATVAAAVTALLTLRYPRLEVVVVNDGSTDATMAVLTEVFALRPAPQAFRTSLPTAPLRAVYRSQRVPRLTVVDKDNGGKADALNAALCVGTGELVCAIDADTLVEPDALIRMVRPFLAHDDCLAAGGTIRVANGCHVSQGRVQSVRVPHRMLAGLQSVEYLRAFLYGRLGWNRLGENLIISGAFGLFRRSSVLAAGGYRHDTVGEDIELVARLRLTARDRGEHGRTVFVSDPVAWTEVPETLRVLRSQRERWHRGLAQTLWRYRRRIGDPRLGRLGLLVLPYYLFVELLGPTVEALGLVGLAVGLWLHAVDYPFAIAFFLAAYAYGLLLNLFGVLLDAISSSPMPRRRDLLLLAGWALVEPLGYRQLTVAWRLLGLIRALQHRSDWGHMPRKGFAAG